MRNEHAYSQKAQKYNKAPTSASANYRLSTNFGIACFIISTASLSLPL